MVARDWQWNGGSAERALTIAHAFVCEGKAMEIDPQAIQPSQVELLKQIEAQIAALHSQLRFAQGRIRELEQACGLAIEPLRKAIAAGAM